MVITSISRWDIYVYMYIYNIIYIHCILYIYPWGRGFPEGGRGWGGVGCSNVHVTCVKGWGGVGCNNVHITCVELEATIAACVAEPK